MATFCEACEALLSYAPAFINDGVTASICNSIQNNTGFVPSNNHVNYDDMQDAIDCLIGALQQKIDSYDICDWKPFEKELLENVYKIYSAINCELKGIWAYMYELLKLIESIKGGIYTPMTKGVDYNIGFYNGFYTSNSGTGSQTQDLNIGYIETFGQYQIKINTEIGSSRTMYNGIMMDNGTDNVEMRHSTSSADVPKSWIYGITFIGNFSSLNSLNLLDNDNQSNGIWNLSPASARARWQHNSIMNKNVTGSSYTFLTSWVSYADGYNQQLSTYYTNGDATTLNGTSGQLNHSKIINLY